MTADHLTNEEIAVMVAAFWSDCVPADALPHRTWAHRIRAAWAARPATARAVDDAGLEYDESDPDSMDRVAYAAHERAHHLLSANKTPPTSEG